MALSLDDESIDRLAEQAQKILKAPSKADAIRQALERVVENDPARETDKTHQAFREKIKDLQDEVKRLGKPNPDFDEKAFLDEMWEN